MRYRTYSPADRDAVRALYTDPRITFCDPDDRLNVVNTVVEDDDGTIVAWLAGRVTIEAVVVVREDKWNSWMTFRALGRAWDALRDYAAGHGLAEIYVPVLPWRERFARMMVKFCGCVLDPRTHLVHVLTGSRNG
jgi:hypothetical protein